MKKSYLLLIFISFFVFSCTLKDENEKLKMENEELAAELSRAQAGVATLEQIGELMDSIDAKRDVIQLDLEAGTTYEDYLKQMEDLTKYVSDTEAKINSLESQFSESSEKNRSYLATIKRLKNDLSAKSKEINELQTAVESYKSENSQLLNMVELQEAEINDKAAEIERKKEELELLDNRMQELMAQAQISEADAYFARAAAIEEAANRTKLAPKKKKETYKEAIELYKRSMALGNTEAEGKIKELEARI